MEIVKLLIDAGAVRVRGGRIADALDLATVFGIGFAPFRGGLAHFGNLRDHPAAAKEKSIQPVVETATAAPH